MLRYLIPAKWAALPSGSLPVGMAVRQEGWVIELKASEEGEHPARTAAEINTATKKAVFFERYALSVFILSTVNLLHKSSGLTALTTTLTVAGQFPG